MKRLFIMLFAALLGSSAHAARLERILQCDGAHVDVNTDERRELQLVVTDNSVLKFLHDKGAVI